MSVAAGESIQLVVALGNPGKEYARTRHNVAWQMMENLSFYNELNWQEKFKGEYATYTPMGATERVFFLKPMTFMNLSGQSLVAMMQFFKITPGRILVVHDDLEIDFGVIGFKWSGGLGGHNGLRSIAGLLGTPDFCRLRLGISRPAHRDITSYVLGPFSEDERIVLPTFLEEAAKLLEQSLTTEWAEMEKAYKKKKLIQ